MNDSMQDVRNYLHAQMELGGNEVFWDEPWTPPISSPRPAPVPSEASAAKNVSNPPYNRQSSKTQQPSSPPSGGRKLLIPSKAPVATDMEMETIETATSLENFHEAIMHHPYYRLGPGKAGRIGFGQGPMHPPLMLVGDSPSEEELRTGAFLEGPAAELLRKLLESVHHSRNLSYATWFAKKPIKTPPLPRQAAVLRRMLATEVRLVQPSLILLLGESVLRNVMEDKGRFEEEGGKPFDFAGVPTTALCAPDLMVAQPQWKVITWREHIPKSGYFKV
ncbi:MAG TPA: uracil-DNA glycosylase family protein [Fibrobacteraceae bacterium]|nr:uracil-DNA glycosylase family protein [Fibrobacteraceae bacterium]